MKKIVLLVTGGAVSAALMEVPKTKNEAPHILRIAREGAPLGTLYDPARFITDLPTYISALATTLGNNESLPIDVCLAAPLTLSQTHTFTEESPEQHTVTQDEITQMIRKASETFVQAHGSLLATLISGEPVALESLLLSSFLNGYSSSNPVGLTARTREYRVYTSLTSRALLDTITSAVSTAWPRHTAISFSSFSYSASQSFANLLPEYDSVIIISIEENHSDVVMVWNDSIADTSTVTLGVNNYLSAVGQALSLDPTQTLSAIRLYAEGGATPEASVKIAEASREIRDTWMKAFSIAAASALEEFFLPDRVVIVSGESGIAVALTHAFAEDLSHLSFTDSTFNFLSLQEEITKRFILPEADVQNPALMLVCLFYARMV